MVLAINSLHHWARPDAGLEEVWRVLSLADYNTRIVVLGTMMLGLAAGVVGTYMLLRKRALIGDAVSHATLPGIALAFLVMASFGGSGRWLPGLLLGAVLSSLVGAGVILLVRATSRTKEDAALGVVLAAGGYPSNYDKGERINGLPTAPNENAKVFHAGTRIDGEDVVTSGGRVLCVVGLGDSVADAQAVAYALTGKIKWNNVYYRNDIGHRAISRDDN